MSKPPHFRRRGCNQAVLAAAIASAAALASPAVASTITFATSPVGGFTGPPTTEDGFTYSLLSGGLFVQDVGNPGQDMEGAIESGGGVLKIVSAGAGTFIFDSVDFAAFDSAGTGSQMLSVEGSLGGSAIGTDQYTLANTDVTQPKYTNWTTEAAASLAGKTLSELDIFLPAGTFPNESFFAEAIDNVVLTPVAAPEPASLMLLVSSLLGLRVARRRKTRPSRRHPFTKARSVEPFAKFVAQLS